MKSHADALADAFARHRKGDLVTADRIYRKVIKAQPDNPDALYLLGMLCLEKDAAGEAARYLELAIGAAEKAGRKPDHGWRLAYGTALQRLGRHEEALAQSDMVLREAPGNADALFCRATALQDLGREEAVVDAYQAVLSSVPGHAEAANNLGVIWRDTGKPGAAQAAFKQAVAADPDYRDAQINLGRALADAGLAADAIPLLRRATATGPYDPVAEKKLFGCLMQVNLIDELESRAATLLKERPHDPFLICQLGVAREARGDSHGAAERFREALAKDPETVAAHLGLSGIRGEAGTDALLGEVERLIADDGIAPEEKLVLYFALGRHHAARGEHAESLDAYAEANRMKRDALAAQGYGFDREKATRAVDVIIARYRRETFEAGCDIDSELPVFVVGMPRSGTTLTEQILASHPRVFGAGELSFIGRAAAELRRRFGYPEKPAPAGALNRIAAAYLEPLAKLGQDALRVTDKQPGNFMYIGLIATLFPKSRIIHCRRDPVDTCVSCFMQNFGASGLSWSYDFGDMAHQYCEYRRLTDHWRKVLPEDRMLEIDYEDTVADLERQARRLVDFVGLDWDDACLRFYEAKGTVVTASQNQVRQKLYASSVGRWKRYGDGLAPLVEALASCGCGPAAERS